MSGLLYLIPIALLLGLSGLGAFFWAIRSGQFDDTGTPAVRMLLDGRPRADNEANERINTLG